VLPFPLRLGRNPAAPPAPANAGRINAALWFARYSLGQGLRDAVLLLRHRSPGVLIGSIGTMAFDLAVLGVCFRAFGYSPPIGVLVLGYLIGQLGGNIPLPGGIGGVDLGLIGTFALYHQPLAATTAAVLMYHAISLWVPGLIGGVAFVQLRRTLRREERPAVICTPLAEPIDATRLPAGRRERVIPDGANRSNRATPTHHLSRKRVVRNPQERDIDDHRYLASGQPLRDRKRPLAD
jgi:hypothetical protein